MTMNRKFLGVLLLGLMSTTAAQAKSETPAADNRGTIQVSGTSTVSITPDRITVEIGMQEYYNKISPTDSVKVDLPTIEEEVFKSLAKAGVPDTAVIVTDVGNYYYYYGAQGQDNFLMAKRIAATLSEMAQLDTLARSMDIKGVNSFRIARTDASNMDVHNRRGLAAALDKAREKAELIAANEGLTLGMPLEIVEDGPLYYDEEAVVTNVALDGAAKFARAGAITMENMKKIVRRYNVRVTYQTTR